ncbi:MAG: response regulator [Planctomycetota bacterium]|jgi:CheY-like chemotaxis protein
MAKNLSTFAIAQMLQVDPGSVANWIDRSLLKAFRTPGGHRRVVAEDLVCFLKAHEMPIPDELRSSPVRVLVVDAEPGVTRQMARAIKSCHSDYEVIEAHDGFKAGALVATLKPEVVILDLEMPGLDGYEVCRLIKSRQDTGGTEVLAMTACPSPESERRILRCGARVCLGKPLAAVELCKEIDAALTGAAR